MTRYTKLLCTTGVAIGLVLSVPLSVSAAQKGVGGAVGNAVSGVTGSVGDAVGGAAGGVQGAAGASKVDLSGQNPGVGQGAEAKQDQATQGSGQGNFGNLVAALNNISAQIQQIQALNNVNVVDVVDASDIASGNNVQVLNDAIKHNKVDIVKLHNVLNKNEVVKNALNKNNVSVNRVVAVSVLSGGDIVVFSR